MRTTRLALPMGRATAPAALAVVLVALGGRPVAAQVIEPNGLSVPATVPGSTEITLQQYFTSVNENIDAVADASTEPSTFLPLCNFQATLVLSQSQAAGGLAWYNVPASPTATPTVYQIGPFPLTVGTAIASADIRSDPNYANGLIGFALMKNLGNGPVPVYYSEDMRNVDCTGCVMPGYWKMALSYESTLSVNTYYMAWEDWEGANATSWPDDGDFNDKVFSISGVTCDGGGVPCPTDLPGVCANGVTQCVVGGNPTCTPQIAPSPEKCDNLDNDCNGQVDDGEGLCPGNQVCVQGTCIAPCSTTEFPCVAPYLCTNGYCVDPRCANVTCQTGQVCQAGICVGGCDGVTCPLGQQCELGVCVDPCANVTCKDAVCVQGACVESCMCQPCANGQVCAPSGACVDNGCESLTCDAGMVCRGGSCIDACEGAVCPGGADCHAGTCDPPPTPGLTGNGGTSDGASGSGGAGGTIVGATGAGGTATGGASGSGASGSSGAGGSTGGSVGPGAGGSSGAHEEGGVVSCSCQAGGGADGAGWAILLSAAGLTAGRRRRRPARP